MGEIPHLKALVERHAEDPFAIVGVNTDDDPDEYRAKVESLGVTWRSAFQGGFEGEVVRQWGVSAFPTIFVLDAEGRIRFKDARGEALEAAVEQLLAELEAGAGEAPEAVDRPVGAPAGGDFDELHARWSAEDAAWEEAWRAAKGRERTQLRKQDPAAGFLDAFTDLAATGEARAALWLTVHLDAGDLKSAERKERVLALFQELVANHGSGEHAAAIVAGLKGAKRDVSKEDRVGLLGSLAATRAPRPVRAEAMAEQVRLLRSGDPSDEDRAYADSLEELLLTDYADTQPGVELWARANRGAYEGVGSVAPDFPGVDTEGELLRLSDYRGEVVLLDFWGYW